MGKLGLVLETNQNLLFHTVPSINTVGADQLTVGEVGRPVRHSGAVHREHRPPPHGQGGHLRGLRPHLRRDQDHRPPEVRELPGSAA